MLRSFLIIVLIYGFAGPSLLPLRLGEPIFPLIRDVKSERVNPALYEYLYFLPINISEELVGSEITIEWNSLIYVKEIHRPERFWKVKSFIAITKLEWARMEKRLRSRVSAWLGDEPLKVLAWGLTDKIPLIGWITLNETTLELAFNNTWHCPVTGWYYLPNWDGDRLPILNSSWILTHEIPPFKEIFLFYETYFPYPGLKNYRCFRLNPESDRLVYRFTEPGHYIPVHKYVVTENIREFDKFKDLRIVLAFIHVVLRSPSGEVLLDKRFMVSATPTLYYEWEKGNMAISDNDKEWDELIQKRQKSS